MAFTSSMSTLTFDYNEYPIRGITIIFQVRERYIEIIEAIIGVLAFSFVMGGSYI